MTPCPFGERRNQRRRGTNQQIGFAGDPWRTGEHGLEFGH